MGELGKQFQGVPFRESAEYQMVRIYLSFSEDGFRVKSPAHPLII